MARKNNDIDPDFTENVINEALIISADGKPQTTAELHDRIEKYFKTCAEGGIRPGYESLAMALHVDRVTFWRWRRGQTCSEEWAQECQQAGRIIDVFLEQSMMQGKISPPTGIFLSKNWLGYRDTISIAESVPDDNSAQTTPEMIAARHGISIGADVADAPLLPDADFLNIGGDEE